MKTKRRIRVEDLKEYQVADKRNIVALNTPERLGQPGKEQFWLSKKDVSAEFKWYERADNYNHLVRGKGRVGCWTLPSENSRKQQFI